MDFERTMRVLKRIPFAHHEQRIRVAMEITGIVPESCDSLAFVPPPESPPDYAF